MQRKIIIYCFMFLLLNGCCGQSKEKAFIAKYELDDFFQFNGVSLFLRGLDKQGNFIVVGYTKLNNVNPEKYVSYGIFLDAQNQIIKTDWVIQNNNDYANIDTLLLQQIAQSFMKYEIPRLDVDVEGNVFVYMKDVETLALARFEKDSEFLKKYIDEWVNIKGNWYKPK